MSGMSPQDPTSRWEDWQAEAELLSAEAVLASPFAQLQSGDGSSPFSRCSAFVARPPENAYLLILSFIWSPLSVTKMALLESEALILPPSPWKQIQLRCWLDPVDA